MSKVFVVPDIHLKPWMLDKATKLIEKNEYDKIVLLGDLIDDWYQEKNLTLYQATFDRINKFLKQYPETIFCIGNHDISYLYHEYESGFSIYAREIVIEEINKIFYLLPENNSAFIHRIDNVLFSHAGLTENFVKRCFGNSPVTDIDELLTKINRLPKKDIWRDDSIIWARPQDGALKIYPSNIMQVVGHTPVEKPLLEYNKMLLTLDNFSTYHNGTPIGNEQFVWIDTVSMEYHAIKN